MAHLIRFMLFAALMCGASSMEGCQAFKLAGGMMQADEDQKLVEELPKYTGLENKTVAIIVTADMSTQFEHPQLVSEIGRGIYEQVSQFVFGAKVLPAAMVRTWMYRTPQWEAMPYGELAKELNVDRVVYVDILEYRLNPPGNRFMWEGVCLGRIGIIERGEVDSDNFIETFDINSKYPKQEGVTRDDAKEQVIAGGLQYDFVQKTTWLFYKHLEPKHPDRYRPQLDQTKQK